MFISNTFEVTISMLIQSAYPANNSTSQDLVQFRLFLGEQYMPVSDEDWCMLESFAYSFKLQKHSFLLNYGEICSAMWFLIRGAVRVFEPSLTIEKTLQLHYAPEMMTNYESLITQKPSKAAYITEVESTFIRLDYQLLLSAYNYSPALERIGRLIAERHFMFEFELRKLLLNNDAQSRYQFMLEKKPEIFQYFALKDIASFIGVTPSSLSRLRKAKMW